MSFHSETAFPEMPGALHWDANQIADAVPRRLSELVVSLIAEPDPDGNGTVPARRTHHSYLPAANGPALFRVRG